MQLAQSFHDLPFDTLIDLVAPTFFLYHICHGAFICIRLREFRRLTIFIHMICYTC